MGLSLGGGQRSVEVSKPRRSQSLNHHPPRLTPTLTGMGWPEGLHPGTEGQVWGLKLETGGEKKVGC